jgi:hypothetical protein
LMALKVYYSKESFHLIWFSDNLVEFCSRNKEVFQTTRR